MEILKALSMELTVDDDANKPDYRLFLVHYFDDPDDGEEMWPEELVRFVQI